MTVVFHRDFADGETVVWAESSDLPGFSAAADSIPAVRALVYEYLADEGIDAPIAERLENSDLDEGAVFVRVIIDGNEVEAVWNAYGTVGADGPALVDA